jgi:drug/metabolite transporter (DMT)-like permease
VLSIKADLSFQQIGGPLGVVLAAFMYDVFSVSSKPLVKRYGAMPVAVRVAVLGTVFILPLLTWNFIADVTSLSIGGWLSVLYLSIPSTVTANIILYTLIGGRAVSRFSVQLYLIPLVSLVGGIVLLGESITAFTILGAGLMLTATALATGRR